MNDNPLLGDWSVQPFGLPPFELITAEHFKPAIEAAHAIHLQELKQIAENPEEPTFANTIVAFDRTGQLKSRILAVYNVLGSSCSSPELQYVQRLLAAPLAAFSSAVTNFPGLFERIDTVFEHRRDQLEGEDRRLLERIHLDFVRQGARFDKTTQARYNEIVQELARLTTTFKQNLLADETEFAIELSEAEMAGCTTDIVAASKQNAIDRGAADGTFVVTVARSMVE
ncbi:peptidase M3, partial [Achlya hypogyna]